MIAHLSGLPVEELAPSLLGVGVALAGVRAWFAVRLRAARRRR